MNTEMASLKIDQSIVTGVVEKTIQEAVIAQLKDPDALIREIVRRALSVKVDSDGKPSSYSSSISFLDYAAQESIRAATRKILDKFMEDNSDKLRKAIRAELNKPERAKSIAKAFADEAEKAISCGWNFTCNISFKNAD
jgi:hypothetical protein